MLGGVREKAADPSPGVPTARRQPRAVAAVAAVACLHRVALLMHVGAAPPAVDAPPDPTGCPGAGAGRGAELSPARRGSIARRSGRKFTRRGGAEAESERRRSRRRLSRSLDGAGPARPGGAGSINTVDSGAARGHGAEPLPAPAGPTPRPQTGPNLPHPAEL